MSLIAEIKRRNVAKVAVLYIVAAWLILQVADVGVSLLELPDWVGKTIFLLLALGFPLALIFSWVYELTPEGLKREKDIERSQSITHETGRKINVLIIVLLIAAIATVLLDRFIPRSADQPAAPVATEAGAVEELEPSQLAAAKFAPAPDRSIAVLPFADMSPDQDQAYFSDGLSEELLNLLANVPELQVASRTSAFSFKGKEMTIADMAAQLNVAHVLEGSVRKAGNKVRITAQLIDAQRDVHMWSQTWDRTLDDVFAIQDEIAKAVVDELKVTLLGAAPKAEETDPEAYTLYLKARQLGRQGSAESMMQALDVYQQVLDIDPNYAPAWDGMGSAYINLANFNVIPQDEAIVKARVVLDQALKADPGNASAQSGLGWVAASYDADYAGAARYYEQALKTAPTDVKVLNAAAVLLQKLGRFEEAIRIHEYIVKRDPLNETAWNNLASALVDADRFEEARAPVDRALELSPDMLTGHLLQAILAWHRGDIETYVAELDWISEKSGDKAWSLEARAAGYPKLGRQAEADAALAELETYRPEDWSNGVAYVYTMRGDKDKAIEWLEKTFEYDNRSAYSNMRADGWMGPLRDDPRFQALLERAGLSDAQVAAIDFKVDLPD